ncbi:M23 family metallopeptidase [Cryobacterium fucosi]|nr:M23 family metallopeptidase [Cryobacterium fucosi]
MQLPRLVAAAALAAASFVPVAVPPPQPWVWPLSPPHRVLAEFVAPASVYSAGHRGLDLAAIDGEPVFAVSGGVVSFAGVVVDRPVLSIRHTGDLASSVEPVTAVVTAGETVALGQLVGHVAPGGHCSARCVHLGARLHGRYVSPRLYLGGIRRAVLLPLEGPSTLWGAR